jgi:hypothetical protein
LPFLYGFVNRNNFFLYIYFIFVYLILAPSVTVKAIGLFLKNSALPSRVSSCSSKSSKSTGGAALDVQQQSPPLKFYPSATNKNNKQTIINYHSQGNLAPTGTTRHAFVNTSRSPNHMPTSTVQHSTTTAKSGQKLMPT